MSPEATVIDFFTGAWIVVDHQLRSGQELSADGGRTGECMAAGPRTGTLRRMSVFERGRRPSPVPPALAAGSAVALGLLGLLAAVGLLGADEPRLTGFGVVLRIFLAVDGGCCLAGALLLLRRRPAGRILTAVGGGAALALPVLMIPAIVVAPADSALGVRAAGGLLTLLVVVLFGLLTLVQSLRRDTARAVAQGPT